MLISDEHLEEYRAIHKNYYGEEISKAEAYDQAVKLLTLMEMIYKPITVEDFHEIMEKRRKSWLAHKDDPDPLYSWLDEYNEDVGHNKPLSIS